MTVETRMHASDVRECDMRRVIWTAGLSAAVIVSTAIAQSIEVPGLQQTQDIPVQQPSLIAPPGGFAQPCKLSPLVRRGACQPQSPPQLCLTGMQRCANLSKPAARMVPL